MAGGGLEIEEVEKPGGHYKGTKPRYLFDRDPSHACMNEASISTQGGSTSRPQVGNCLDEQIYNIGRV